MYDWDDRDGSNVHHLPLRILPARLPDPISIPPREWLYGTRLIRRFVTVMVVPGGTGKSAYALGVAMALASGRAFLGERVHHSVKSWVMNLEDPLEEIERRVAALMLRHQIGRNELDGRLFLHSGRDRRLVIAKQSDDGYDINYPDKDGLIEAALSADIGHIVVDPFVKSHALEENSNPHMDAAATAWAEVGQATGASIELVHHTRKGAATDIDAARGGKALTDAARVGQVMSSMSLEEAAELGIKETERWQYVRLDDAKTNMAPRSERARWFRLEMVELGNTTVDYPHGDRVAAIAPWEPPSLFHDLSDEECNHILDQIEAGPEPGALYRPDQRGGSSDRWVGNVLVNEGVDAPRAKLIIKTWLANGLLVRRDFRDSREGKSRSGVTVDNSKRPG